MYSLLYVRTTIHFTPQTEEIGLEKKKTLEKKLRLPTFYQIVTGVPVTVKRVFTGVQKNKNDQPVFDGSKRKLRTLYIIL